MYAIGELRHIFINMPLGETDSTPYLRPGEGEEWIPIFLYACHNNVAGTTQTWHIVDDLGNATLVKNESAAAATSFLWFQQHQYATFLYPPKLTREIYARYSTASCDADKQLNIRGLVIVRPENIELLFQEWIAHKMGFNLPIKSRE